MKQIFSTLVLFLTLLSFTFAQTADLQFVEVTNDGTNYDVKVQIKGSPAFKLGSSNIKFNFNKDDLSNPTLSEAHNFSGGSYNTITVTEPKPGIASINIELFSPNNGSDVNTSWTDVATIRFTTVNPNGSSQLSFRDMNPPETNNPTVIYKDDEANQVSQGTFSTLNSTPLPVELQSFKATNQKGSSVELEWTTATEVNNYGFEIERKVVKSVEENKMAENTWEKVGFVKGSGNSNAEKIYSYVDKNPVGGTKFAYRLKQIDIDGTFEYSDEIEVEVLPAKYELFQNYPNPFNPTTKIKFSLPENAKVKISVYDVLGRKVATLLNKNVEAGYHSINFNAKDFTSGIYIYSIETNKFTQVKKMLLLK